MSLQRVLLVAGSVLLLLQIVKFSGVLSAIRWILANGREFIVELRKRQDTFSEAAYWEVLDRCNGRAVPPFGVLEYRLLRFASRRGRAAGVAIRFGRTILYDFTAIGVYVAAFLLITGAPALRNRVHGPVTTLAWISAGLGALQLIAIYAEACVSYARIGSYGLGFHGASRYVERERAGTYFAEVKTLVGAVLYSLLIGSMIFYFSAGHGARYDAFRIAQTTPAGVAGDVLTCVYFAVMTFFTADTPDARNGVAHLATVILVLQAVCALVLALTTATMYIAPDSRPEPPPVDPPAPEPSRLPVQRPARSGPAAFVTGVVIGVVLAGAGLRARRPGRRR
ncbi:hypothetical protein ACWT_4234 [Actinoplanes sp. SE50]|uniref:hypothetical protein n=1 Tax=unclassified Actinoplanes TaxID=2626549 RepID=UPI00023EC492|nr:MULTISPECIES: hypothetical protein [unclassified Actinoplanes]AEV85254.1 hypothetical protein ACPL_4363 [Actinoplanes sp. SE50/110]ATO83649.1 hypothetical protein ACWT_4234 [Actinoplanes sp. SE50]SLM01057.1 hypothetical protein ACSP50_4290 [Actinoplanes sp. SE50/110]